MSYQWYTARNVGVYPPTGGGSPPFYTPSSIPKAVVRCPSPNGAGDILERVEVAGYYGVNFTDATLAPDAPIGTFTHLLGEVGSSSSTPPDPGLTGAHDFAFTATMELKWETPTFGSPVATYPLILRASTGGYITSRARRGPASYGSGAPSFNLGLVTEDPLAMDPTISSAQSYWAFYVRCLWRTP